MVKLSSDIAAGNIGALMVYDCNPVYTYPDGNSLANAIAKLPVSISFNCTMDETTEQCKYIIPSPHWLESWGDAEPKTGFISLIQPVINPLFKTRDFQSSLIKWAAINTQQAAGTVKDSIALSMPVIASATNDYPAYLKNYWAGKLGTGDMWNKALQDGVIESAPATAAGTYNAGALASAAAKIASVKGASTEIMLYEKISIGNGAHANNPWLQELPDPVTKVTWDNYAMMSPEMAKSVIDIDVMSESKKQADDYEVHPEKPVVKITVNGRSLSLPVLILPGMNASTIAIAVGYGRGSSNKEFSTESIGRAATGSGHDSQCRCYGIQNGRYLSPGSNTGPRFV